jgi:3-methyl-2-oxobutanoate hydroxymethyltransferase
MTVPRLAQKKIAGEKIAALAAYDFPTARLAAEAGIDIVLVGDSLGMALQGMPDTLRVTMDEMVYHTRMVARAAAPALVVADMPYGSYHAGLERSVENALRLVKEGGAAAVKLEGGRKRFAVVQALLAAEIPVMGHLGLTPQSLHAMGGFKVQGRLAEQARAIYADAQELERLGVFAIVLESIPLELARKISDSVAVPTIGIGAGPGCDGQVLVFHDLAGISGLNLPKFVRPYADTRSVWLKALRAFAADVRRGSFPNDGESYHLDRDIDDLLK